MPAQIQKLTRWLTIRYLFAIGLVAVLSITNFWLLRAEMRANEASVELLTVSGRQRTLLQSTALLAQALVSVYVPEERIPLRRELIEATESLERAHYRLVEFDPSGTGDTPAAVKEIYDSTPWLLDTEIRNYLTQLRELAKGDDTELSFLNPHYRYVREVTLRGEVMRALEEVVREYQSLNESLAARLRSMVWFSMSSTLVVLALAGLFVFQPMVRQVGRDVLALNNLNSTLEARVAERTRVAETKAKELAQSEARYHSLVETLPMGVARLDDQERYIYVNRPFCDIVGQASKDILGNTYEKVFREYRPERGNLTQLSVGNPGQLVRRLARSEDSFGSPRILELINSPVEGDKGSQAGLQTIVWDITQRQAAEERALHAERLAAIGEMIAGVAHESRNALQQINACAKLLEWEIDANETTNGLVADIQKAHDRLHRLFENLRGYASPIRVECRPVLLADVFQEAWKAILHEVNNREVSLFVSGDTHQTQCMADPYQWEQVFRNILENAMAACADPVEIRVQWSEKMHLRLPVLCVAISDNGPGLADEAKQRIFEPFYTTRTRGTGLGMAIVQRIVQAHGGEIEASSLADVSGTHIYISLPRGAT